MHSVSCKENVSGRLKNILWGCDCCIHDRSVVCLVAQLLLYVYCICSMFHYFGIDSSQCSLCICNSIEIHFRSCHSWVLACFWIRGAWRMNRQAFIARDYVFLAIIRLNGFTFRHIERGVVHLTNTDTLHKTETESKICTLLTSNVCVYLSCDCFRMTRQLILLISCE